jgi:hypothetical protein
MSAAVSQMSTSSFVRSSSAAPIEPAWVLVSPSAGGALKRMMAESMLATFLVGVRMHGRPAAAPGSRRRGRLVSKLYSTGGVRHGRRERATPLREPFKTCEHWAFVSI